MSDAATLAAARQYEIEMLLRKDLPFTVRFALQREHARLAHLSIAA